MHRSRVIFLGVVIAISMATGGVNCQECASDADCADGDDCTADACVAQQCVNTLEVPCRGSCGGLATECCDELARQPAGSFQFRVISRWPRNRRGRR